MNRTDIIKEEKEVLYNKSMVSNPIAHKGLPNRNAVIANRGTSETYIIKKDINEI